MTIDRQHNVFVRPSLKTGQLQVRVRLKKNRILRFYMDEAHHDLIHTGLDERMMFFDPVVLG